MILKKVWLFSKLYQFLSFFHKTLKNDLNVSNVTVCAKNSFEIITMFHIKYNSEIKHLKTQMKSDQLG